MKRILYTMLVIACLIFTACGSKNESNAGSSSQKTDVDTYESTEDDIDDYEYEDYEDYEEEEFAGLATIEQTVLFDKNDVKITANSLECDNYDVTLKLTIENNAKETLKFSSGTIGYCCNMVNGYMISDGYLNEEIKAGKKANVDIEFSIKDLMMYGITDIADIAVGFSVKDDNGKDYLVTGPLDVRTSLADSYDYESDTYTEWLEKGILLGQEVDVKSFEEKDFYNDGGICLKSCAHVVGDEEFLLLEYVNQSDKTVGIYESNVCINGIVADSGNYSHEALVPGAKAVGVIKLNRLMEEEVLSLLEIDSFDNVSFEIIPVDEDYNEIAKKAKIELVLNDDSVYTMPNELIYNDNNIGIANMGVSGPASDYGNAHLVLLVQNNRKEEISVDSEYDSFSINGYMIGDFTNSESISPGKMGIIDVEFNEDELIDAGISGVDAINQAEITLEIENDENDDIAKPELKMEF